MFLFLFWFGVFVYLFVSLFDFFCTELPMDDIKSGSSLEVLCTGCSSSRPSTCARCHGGGPEGWPHPANTKTLYKCFLNIGQNIIRMFLENVYLTLKCIVGTWARKHFYKTFVMML